MALSVLPLMMIRLEMYYIESLDSVRGSMFSPESSTLRIPLLYCTCLRGGGRFSGVLLQS